MCMQDENIYVLGHKNPDTDSICAPIAYAFYKDKEMDVDVLSQKILEVILEYFDVNITVIIAMLLP